LRSDLDFQTFLSFFAKLWVRGSCDFVQRVEDSESAAAGRWASGIRLLRQLKERWSNWDANGNSLAFVVSEVKHCYFCDDSFTRIMPTVQNIKDIANRVCDSTGLYTSKLISQLFYDIAVPFDTASAAKQRRCGYDPKCYGDKEMRAQARNWLLANKKSIDDFRGLDDAPVSCWISKDRAHCEIIGSACSRVLDKLFYA